MLLVLLDVCLLYTKLRPTSGKHQFDSYSIFNPPGYTQKPLPAPFNAHRQQLTKLRSPSPLNLPTFTSYFTHCFTTTKSIKALHPALTTSISKHSHIVSAPLLTAIPSLFAPKQRFLAQYLRQQH
jgi:hypothetical protein